MLLAALRDDSYNVVLLIHVAAVIVTFAPVIAGLLGQIGLSDAAADLRATLARSQQKMLQSVSMGAFAVVLITGVGMILMSDDAIEFSDAAISIAFVLWIAIAGLVSGMVAKGERQKAEGDDKGRDLVVAGSSLALLLAVVAIYLMVFEIGIQSIG